LQRPGKTFIAPRRLLTSSPLSADAAGLPQPRSREENQYQYRFCDIVDPDSGKPLFTVEHEVRSATHPMFMRPMVNRKPALTNRNYAFGHDQSLWAMALEQYEG
jgi:hypothetical protein